MRLIATYINLFHVCKRQLWLHAHGITMEHSSGTVSEGKLVQDTSFQKRSASYAELEIEGGKIDFFDAKNRIVHEVKKSDRLRKVHLAQLKYYLYLLENKGLEGVRGILEYPKQRKKEEVELSDEDRTAIPTWEKEIKTLLEDERCPPLVKKPYCKTCSYFDFCYSD